MVKPFQMIGLESKHTQMSMIWKEMQNGYGSESPVYCFLQEEHYSVNLIQPQTWLSPHPKLNSNFWLWPLCTQKPGK